MENREKLDYIINYMGIISHKNMSQFLVCNFYQSQRLIFKKLI